MSKTLSYYQLSITFDCYALCVWVVFLESIFVIDFSILIKYNHEIDKSSVIGMKKTITQQNN